LTNGRDPNAHILLRVFFNGKLLSHDPVPQQVVTAEEARNGARVLLEIQPVEQFDGYKPGDYFGTVNLMFNAAVLRDRQGSGTGQRHSVQGRSNDFQVPKKRMFVCAAGAMFCASVQAVTQEMRASYIPDPSRPQNNTFIDQTVQGGYCGTYVADCKAHNLSGVRLPLRFASVRSIEPGATVRNGAMFRIPNRWRSLTVRNVVSGETATVEMRIGGLGTQYVLSDTARSLTGAASRSTGPSGSVGRSRLVVSLKALRSRSNDSVHADLLSLLLARTVGNRLQQRGRVPDSLDDLRLPGCGL